MKHPIQVTTNDGFLHLLGARISTGKINIPVQGDLFVGFRYPALLETWNGRPHRSGYRDLWVTVRISGAL